MKLLKLSIFLLLLPLLLSGQEIDDNILQSKHYKKRIAQFAANPLKKGQIVFIGNSITEAGKWATYFPKQAPANRGISGDNTDGMLARIHEVIVARPSKVFIMAGINDMSLQRENSVIVRQIKMLVRQIMAGSPDTEIYIQSILPLNDEKLKYKRLESKQQQIEQCNIQLQTLCEEMGLGYVDVCSLLSESPGTLNSEYTSDGLHINQAAYQVWADYIKDYILEP